VEGKRGSECLLKSVSNIDFNPLSEADKTWAGKNYVFACPLYIFQNIISEMCKKGRFFRHKNDYRLNRLFCTFFCIF
jgi:hypothetical protein